ncbi:prepilin peptidase-dependent protein [Yersinia mollaretii]|uniref:prepilin peptidase-dependent protein n=1 Tax=Yersinia mollaretii TaxID=33060 RepID=UPI0005E6E8AB|nr:prepilin peptidase-dependent protein [Yersinia mollaretii]PJE87487.1 prepilin-type cleavage/methylation domain-containing protein [Yersinia mollaretii]CQD37979.1 prepilin peptidase dependent protein B [Yersinia mollaretii]CQH04484.1 prepilin peptidase dependent protein B [Yersinia mollaretii]
MPRVIKKPIGPLSEHFWHKDISGFTLPEMMLALSIGSMIMLGSAQVFPKLRQQISTLQQHYHLELVLSQAMATLEKDLRRAGFCHGECKGKSVTTQQYPGETTDSCLIVAYDLNRNGRWEGEKHQESEYFGYRLRNKALETQRGELNCAGGGWERVFDPKEVTVTHFSVRLLSEPASAQIYRVQLAGQSTSNAAVHHQLIYKIRGNNL